MDSRTNQLYVEGKKKFQDLLEDNPNYATALAPRDMQGIDIYIKKNLGRFREKSQKPNVDKDDLINDILDSYELFATKMTEAMKAILTSRDEAVRAWQEKGKKGKREPQTPSELLIAFEETRKKFLKKLPNNSRRSKDFNPELEGLKEKMLRYKKKLDKFGEEVDLPDAAKAYVDDRERRLAEKQAFMQDIDAQNLEAMDALIQEQESANKRQRNEGDVGTSGTKENTYGALFDDDDSDFNDEDIRRMMEELNIKL